MNVSLGPMVHRFDRDRIAQYVVGGIWLTRNWRRLARGAVRSPELRIIECRSLGGRQALWIVGYRRQRLLVGSSPAGITLVSELPDASADEPLATPAPDFAEAFRQVLGRRA